MKQNVVITWIDLLVDFINIVIVLDFFTRPGFSAIATNLCRDVKIHLLYVIAVFISSVPFIWSVFTFWIWVRAPNHDQFLFRSLPSLLWSDSKEQLQTISLWMLVLVIVVGSRPSCEGFSPGSPLFLLPQKPTLLNSNSIGNPRATGLLVARLLSATLVK